ncbi:MAG: phosphoribosylaminoimidazolesuccinocarboxamide synthase [Synechococcaceae cyanobacterium SM2_3_2]|nr:phosphoribosylaminoimidazolesuccinocarboxamide synthase [Synechococcaceae cyanobacterium SM2_3_2]
MVPLDLLYEGKAKRVYLTADPEVLVCQYKDDATAFDAQKKGTIAHKGEVNCTIASRILAHLEKAGIPTHFLAQLSPTEMAVRAVQIMPLEVVVRNRAAGSLCKRLGIEQGLLLDPVLTEFYYKNDVLRDPLLTLEHIQLLKLASPTVVDRLRELALHIDLLLIKFFAQCDLELVDFKLEFGVTSDQQLLLADEISPDTCRLWDQRGAQPGDPPRVLDKDLFRFDLGDPVAGYQEVLQRVLAVTD